MIKAIVDSSVPSWKFSCSMVVVVAISRFFVLQLGESLGQGFFGVSMVIWRIVVVSVSLRLFFLL